MNESAAQPDLGAIPAEAVAAVARASAWERWGKNVLMFALITLAYMLSYSFDENDAMFSGYWMERNDVHSMIEFRHLAKHILPHWLWQFLAWINVSISSMALLDLLDFFSSAASVMLLYRLILEITGSRKVSFASAFGYGTAHCVWLFAGSGRLYSTSMFLVIGAFYLALQVEKLSSQRARLVVAFTAGAFVSFSAMFWLANVFNAVGVGLLFLLLPVGHGWLRRVGAAGFYAAAGIVLTLAVTASLLAYVQIPLEPGAVQQWLHKYETPPLQFDPLSVMKATFGQAHGILVMNELPYLINGMMLKDAELMAVGSFPWQFGKFAFVWLLLTLVYLYPLALLRRSTPRLRILIIALYVTLAINMYVALGWLGSDVQRFMPALPAQFCLAAIAVQHLLRHAPQPRMVAAFLVACLAFIAADNLLESLLPSQRHYIVLAADMKAARPYLQPGDLVMNFGRDMTMSYQTMVPYFTGARTLTMTNNAARYTWDRGDWKENLEDLLKDQERRKARLFLPDRVVTGVYPPKAAWSNKQHSKPTVKQFAKHLRDTYCVVPGFQLGEIHYYQVLRKASTCPANSMPALTE